MSPESAEPISHPVRTGGRKGSTHVLVLEQLRRAEEERRRLLGVKRLADIEEVDDAGEQGPALAGAYGGLIEDAGLLDDGCLVVVVCAEAALLVLFRGERHGEVVIEGGSEPGSTSWKRISVWIRSLGVHASSQASLHTWRARPCTIFPTFESPSTADSVLVQNLANTRKKSVHKYCHWHYI